MMFQWRYFHQSYRGEAFPNILNVGSADDPLNFEHGVLHYDIDRFTCHKFFVQGNAHFLPFAPRSFEVVLMGDIIEHLRDPRQAVLDAARVADRYLVMTIFEEWRLPGIGTWIAEGQDEGDRESQRHGFADRKAAEDFYHPGVQKYDDKTEPHWNHIQQFSDEMIAELVQDVPGYRIREFEKEFEAKHEGHDWYNWLVALEREVPQ